MIPKFSIRQMLLLMIAIGVIAACMAGAARGNKIAFGLSVAIVGSILPMLVMAVVHWFSLGIALLSTLTDHDAEKKLSYSATASPAPSTRSTTPWKSSRQKSIRGQRGMLMRKILPIVVMLIGCFIFAAAAVGQGKAMPTGIVPKGVSGYTVTIQDDWVCGHQGLYPIRVTLKTNPAKNVVNDTRFTVSISSRRYSQPSNIVSTPLIIPAGRNSGSVELYVDMGNSNNSYQTEVLVEKGEYDGRLDRQDVVLTSVNTRDYYGMQPSVLFVSSGFSQPAQQSWVCYQDKMQSIGSPRPAFVSNDPIPRINLLDSVYEQSNPGTTSKPGTATSPWIVVSNSERIHGVHPDYLPVNWIGLSSIDQILISMTDFKTICLKQDADRARIEQWIVAGGTLIVFDTGPGFQEADKIWPFLLGPERAPNGDQVFSEWSVPGSKIKSLRQLLPRAVNQQQYYYDQNTVWLNSDAREVATVQKETEKWKNYEKPSLIPAAGQTTNQKNANLRASKSVDKFAISHYVNGRIIAINDDLSTWNASDWRELQNAITSSGGEMSNRIGLSTGSIEMPGLAIPGVGEPPIRTFQILIGLFLLLAGPVMLIVLKRTGQMQYLFVAVPWLSMMVCLSLFFYAILVDGSNRWGRTQSVTTINHRTNMSVTHSRTNYYSGVNPGRYDFPEHTMSLVPPGGASNSIRSRFVEGKQEISGGDIRARMPHEVISIRSQMSPQRLTLILPQADSKDQLPAIRNRLGADVKLVVFRTDDGLFMIENLKADEMKTATEINDFLATTKAFSEIKSLSPYLENAYSGSRRNRYGRRYYYGQVDDSELASYGEDARVIETIRGSKIIELLSRPKTYVAILEQFPLAAEQVEPVDYKLQVHVVRGQW